MHEDVLTWHAPTADALSFRSLLAFTFGNRMEPNGNRAPGPVNEAIATIAAEVQRRERCRSLCPVGGRGTARGPLAGRHRQAHPPRPGRPFPSPSISARWQWSAVLSILPGGPSALGRVGIIAFRDHLRRCVATARALGLDDGARGRRDAGPLRLALRPAVVPRPDRVSAARHRYLCGRATRRRLRRGEPGRVKKLERPEAQRPSGISIAVAEVVRYDLRTVHDAIAGVGTGRGRVMDLRAPGLRDRDGGPGAAGAERRAGCREPHLQGATERSAEAVSR